MKIKIGFFGTPDLSAAVLQECLMDSDIEVVFVVSQADKPVGRKLLLQQSPVSLIAIQNNIPLFRPEKIRGNDEFMKSILSFQVDYLVVVAYGKILPVEILKLPRILPINIHGSLLPKYRGASPIQASLIAGEKETGVSIMRMDEGMDEGGVIFKKSIIIDQEETSESLFSKFKKESPKALLFALKEFNLGNLTIVEQEHSLATYTKKIDKEDGRILWNTWSGNLLYNYWQGFTPWPGVWTFLNGKRCIFTQCRRSDRHFNGGASLYPGMVSIIDNSVFVWCMDGVAIEIFEILIEGKPRKLAKDVLKNGDCFVSYL